MMNFVVRYRIITDRGSGFVNGNYIQVFWDDEEDEFVTYKYDDSTLTDPDTITTGPNLGVIRQDYDVSGTAPAYGYKFCDGTTLNRFGTSSTFPYANRFEDENHFSCALTVCDLAFSDGYRVTPASDAITNDGSISVTASSSQDSIRYSLNPDFDYAAGEGQPDGNFPDLYAGDYTITAKDALGCVSQITVTVGIPEIYAVRYRLEFTDHYGRDNRTDIEERGYEGEIEEVTGNEDPVIIKYNGDGELNKFTPIVPSELQLTLMSLTNFQFHDLFSQDERKYRVKHYIDYSNVIAPTDEIPGDTVPLNLDALSFWDQIINFSFLATWSSDAPRTVSFAPYTIGVPPRTTETIRPFSSTLYTQYNFIEGYDYSINLFFETNGSNKIRISVVDEFKVVQFENEENFTPGSDSINLSFTANADCKRVHILVTNSSFDVTYVELTNITGTVTSPTIPATPGGPAGLELQWQGFIISSNYQEAYIAPPYPVTITATDGLADLGNYDFVNYPDDNKYTEDITNIKAITDILQRTDLKCNFISGINKFETRMDNGETDDPLTQSKFNPDALAGKNAHEALTEILKPFGAIIRMRKGKFYAYIMEQSASSIPYREFDYKGVFVGNGTFNDVRDINYPIIESGAMFMNRDQVLEKLPTYGKFYFEHTLVQTPSLIDSYSFEAGDVYEDTNGVKLFRGWNVNINNAPGATFGIKETKSFEGEYNFFYKPDSSNLGTNPGAITLTSATQLIEYEATDMIELRFNYAVLLRSSNGIPPQWVRLKWSLKIGDYYLNDALGGWTEDIAYNDIYVTKYNDSNELKLVAPLRDVSALTVESLQIEFILESTQTLDFESDVASTQIKDIPTVDLQPGKKIKGLVTQVSPPVRAIFYYVLVEDDASQSIPTIIRPDDYGSSNQRVWKLETNKSSNYYTDPGEKGVSYWYLDNVVVRHLPDGTEPPENITIERVNNRNIRVNFEEQYLLNDIDIDNINNSERTYVNFFKLLDGSPTQLWERTYRTGQDKLMALLSSEFISQYQTSSDKLTGSILCVDEILPTTVLREVNNNNTKYMFMGYELHAKKSAIVFDLSQIKDVVSDDESEEIDAGFTTGFTLGFRS